MDVYDNSNKLISTGITANVLNSGNSKGVYDVNGLEKGKNYKLAVSYTFPSGEKIIIGNVNVNIGSDGEMNLSTLLVDPYGTITDALTHKIIPGADVKLYYANTERNIAAGITPDTLVQLPKISGFNPADNENPQSGDNNGKYAYMIYPNTDYYVVVTKDGYEKYTSPTISVYKDIVKKDVEMNSIAQKALNTNVANKPSEENPVAQDTLAQVLPKTGSPIDANSLSVFAIVLIIGGLGLTLKPKKDNN